MGTTLWDLPAQPLPKSNVVDSTFVTIWAFVCLSFVALFTLKLRGPKATWPEFEHIRNSTVLLSIFYTILAIDRWLHYEGRAVTYGYILVEPISHGVLYLGSTLWYFWGTYIVLWNDLERRFRSDENPGYWWLAAKVVFFIVCLVSLFFAGLNIATRVVWLEFCTFNVIADVATKRNHFEIAMTVFFTVFGLFTIIAAGATFIVRARASSGDWARTRVYILMATVMLFLRSLAECIIATLVITTSTRRQDTRMAYDIATGLLTTLYLTFMYLQAFSVARILDTDGGEAEHVQSDVRQHILRKLGRMTNHHQTEPPTWPTILEQTLAAVDSASEEDRMSFSSTLSPENKKKVARSYIKKLAKLNIQLKQPTLPPAANPRPVHSARDRRAGPYDSSGSQSAPLASSTLHDNLVDQSSRTNVRHTVSYGDMRPNNGPSIEAPRFGHAQNHPNTWSGSRPPRMSTLQEHPPPAPTTNARLSSHQLLPADGRWGPPPPAAPQNHVNWSRPPPPETSPTNQRFSTFRESWHGGGNIQPPDQQPAPFQTRRVFDLNAPPGEIPSNPQTFGARTQPTQPGGWGQQQQHHQDFYQDAPEEMGVMTPPQRPTVPVNGADERRTLSDSQFPLRPLQTPDSLKPPHLRRTRPAVDESHRAFTDPALVQQQQQRHFDQQNAQQQEVQQPSFQQHQQQRRQFQPQQQPHGLYTESVTSGPRSPVKFVYDLQAPTNSVSVLSDMTTLQAQISVGEMRRKPLERPVSEDVGPSAPRRNGDAS